MAARDFPRSLGTRADGPHLFKVEDLVQRFHLDECCPQRDLERLMAGGKGYQVWGLPRGAEIILKDIQPDDWLMLLGSKLFEYIGQVAYRVPRFCDVASRAIWGETRFPIIVLLVGGRFIDLPFDEFSMKLGFASNYHMRGNTMKVGSARYRIGGVSGAEELAEWCMEKGALKYGHS